MTKKLIGWFLRRVMADYMPRVGTLGHDMMFRSTTIQVRKLRH